MKNSLRKFILLFGLFFALFLVFRASPPLSIKKETIALASNLNLTTSSIQAEIFQGTSAPPCFFTPGVPYRAAGSKIIYLVTPECTKYPLRGVNAFFSFFDSYNSISEVPADTLNAVPLDSKIKSAGWGPKKVFLSGTIVRDEGADTYYLLMNKTLYPFASTDVINSFGLRVKSAQDVDPLFTSIYTIGHTLNTLSDLPPATVFRYPNSSRLYVLDIDTDGKINKKYIAVYSLFSRNYATNQIVRFPVSYSVPYGAQKSISTSKVIKSIIQSSVDTNPPQKESNSGSGVENGSGQTSNNGQDGSEKPSSPATGNTGSNGQTQTSSSTPSAATSSINSVFPKTTAPIGGGSSRNDNGGPQPTVSAGTTNLSLMVTAGSSSVTPSTSVLFTIEYRNLGTGTATGVVIQEIVPTSTFFSVNGSTGSWDCADRSATGTVCLATIGSVAPGATSSIIFAITPSSSFEGTFSNTTTIYDSGSLGADTDTNNNTAYSSSVSVDGNPDMSISVAMSSATTTVSSTIMFTLTYRNLGTVDAPNVTLAATVPSGTIFASASSTGSWSCSDGAAAGTRCTSTVGTVPLGVTGTQVFAVKESYSHVFKTANFSDYSLIIVSSTLTSSLSVASSNSRGQDTSATNNSTTSTILLQQVPLIDMGSLTYKGFFGGLYPNMSNTVPSAHDTAGLAAAAQIQPLNTSGVADSVNGKIVLLSIGMSNATQDFCTAAGNDGVTCDSWTFSGQASTSLQVNTSTVKIINGARGGQSIEYWDSATTNDAGNSTVNNYELTKTNRLTPNGLTEAQVQVVWLKAATGTNTSTLPNAGADAYYLRTYIGRVARAAKTRYPNLKLMFITSRAFSYDPSYVSLSQEPFTYEGGYAVKWAIEAQIHQMENGGTIVDTEAGDLNYNNGTAPWMAWGPYIWANGTIANSEGTTWAQSDLESDHIHPSQAGETKVGTKLLNFFLGSSYTSSWFVKP